MGASLRVELFPADVRRSVGFYEAFGFRVRKDDGDYVYLERDAVFVGLVQSPAVQPERRAWPIGTELVLEVDDVRAERERVGAAGLTVAEELQDRPWGLVDFRLTDPDGYYWRVTGR